MRIAQLAQYIAASFLAGTALNTILFAAIVLSLGIGDGEKYWLPHWAQMALSITIIVLYVCSFYYMRRFYKDKQQN